MAGNSPSAATLAVAGLGGLFVYSGIKGGSISGNIRSLVTSGKLSGTQANQITSGTTSSTGTKTATNIAALTSTASYSQQQADVIDFAALQVGKAYVYDAAGPDAYDCSGLTMKAYAVVGIALPHNAAAQFAMSRPVNYADAQPADILFYEDPIGHCALYIGNGMLIQAATESLPIQQVPVYNYANFPMTGVGRFL
jgi:cell wall-associated NlpC family hydrolase